MEKAQNLLALKKAEGTYKTQFGMQKNTNIKLIIVINPHFKPAYKVLNQTLSSDGAAPVALGLWGWFSFSVTSGSFGKSPPSLQEKDKCNSVQMAFFQSYSTQ